jgi:integrase
MTPVTMYRLVQTYLEALPGAMKAAPPGGARAESCVYTPHSLRATTATLLLDTGVDIRKVQGPPRPPPYHHHPDLRQAPAVHRPRAPAILLAI